MRVLVIGTTGQLSTELARAASSFQLDLASPERFDLADERATLARLDLVSPQLVINAAAYTAVDRAESEPARARAVNAEGPARVAAWCRAHGAALLHVSTDYVFDGNKPGPYVESDACAPLNVYGQTKLEGENLVRAELDEHVIVRTSWVFSAHGQNFVKTMLRLARERDELRVVADQHGRPTSAADLARALSSLAQRFLRERSLAWGTYHFASRGATTWHGFAEAIVEEQAAHGGKRPRVCAIESSQFPTPAKRPKSSVLDTTLFEQTFGLTPRAWRDDLSDVIREVVAPAR